MASSGASQPTRPPHRHASGEPTRLDAWTTLGQGILFGVAAVLVCGGGFWLGEVLPGWAGALLAIAIVPLFFWLCGLCGVLLVGGWRRRQAAFQAESGTSTASIPDVDPVAKARRWARRFTVWTGVLIAVFVASAYVSFGLLGLDTQDSPQPGTAGAAIARAAEIVADVAFVAIPIAALLALFAWVRWWRIRGMEANGGYLRMTPEEAQLLYQSQRDLVREAGGGDAEAGVWGMQMRLDIVEEADVEVPGDLAVARDRAQEVLAAVGAAPLQENCSVDGSRRVRGISARPSMWWSGAPVLLTVALTDQGNGRTLAHVRAAAKYQRKREHALLEQVVFRLGSDAPPDSIDALYAKSRQDGLAHRAPSP